ncbi:hypothetical protein V8J82_20925 [Gymnodinialimonas sp. 2305UL16-5]|uniref:hypothetical protein n=1 Tax=Gymnodinialimonas mytili TaxID=3126503 RepID=UPI0030A139DD
MPVGADILLVIAALVSALALSSLVAGWTERRWPWMALVSLSIGMGLFVYLHFEMTDGLTWTDVPDAFISVAARILN